MDFLLEIGVEDLPSRFLTPALDDLAALLHRKLTESDLGFDEITALGTPRRLAVHVSGLAERQPERTDLKLGPPIHVAYDGEGNPTPAAISFAAKFGLTEADLRIAQTPKGQRVQVEMKTGGASTVDLLPGIAESLVAELPLPKAMRWGAGEVRFLRPIRWLAALAGDAVLPLEIGEVKAGRRSRGHRFLADSEFELPDASLEGYRLACLEHHVIPDGTAVDDEGNVQKPGERYTHLKKRLEELLSAHGKVRVDEELLLDVTNAVEHPTCLEGGFEERFLELPEVVVSSVLKEYQKYFEVRDASGKLLPRFIVVRDGGDRNAVGVVAGHERVLRARLTDAAFFWEQDRKRSLASLTEELADLQFIKGLGSYSDKRNRLLTLVQSVNAEGFCDADPTVAGHLERAASLAKQDLLTRLVVEFTGLQGLIGGDLARTQKEPEPVWRAVSEQYLPKGFTGRADELPQTAVGCLLALLDRLDTLAGCFAVGLSPTGSRDPYGLRRAARGIIGIAAGVEGHEPTGFDHARLDLDPLLHIAVSNFTGTTKKAFDEGEVCGKLVTFIAERALRLLGELGLPTDAARAALGAYPTRPWSVWRSAHSLARAKGSIEFADVAAGYKRACNILRQADKEFGLTVLKAFDANKLEKDEERRLSELLARDGKAVADAVGRGDFDAALGKIAGFREAIDRFFDEVTVFTDSEGLRDNRLALLNELVGVFGLVGDLSLIQAE
ncbi:MAG: glycine--tRNA ligase subunit beta [Candidatus Coatesbacteria bacterium RBG_13_66_14]|uniref:Glycine--tRNA ligase beta subunit n=1 Tax=Candidatus Coatesbacteria bacterium RBG_13_66_14 TaxID=1817816 RepID=A0A1F5FFP0_9BACT|nr:MAG: glycine--tRNA ligase subunit beta [Candidatus Coatesbacteria bacterium RBG_13_66_14]